MKKTTSVKSNTKLSDIKAGDTVKVHQRIKEGDKERIQIFEGIVIARKHGTGTSSTITVRKVVDSVGVERIFPVNSPAISKIEIIRSGKVRRSKLYYLRGAKGKKARLKNVEFASAIADEPEVQAQPEAEVVSPEAEAAPEAEVAPETKTEVPAEAPTQPEAAQPESTPEKTEAK